MLVARRRGFTLIELLTVIAIIALISAILLPTFSRVSEGARATTCMSNLHSLYVAACAYRDDNGGYPPVLFGVAENLDGSKYKPGDSGLVEMKNVKHGFLYPQYINDAEKFHCPDSQERKPTVVVNATMPANSAWNSILSGGIPTYSAGPFKIPGLTADYNNVPVQFYGYDSYDVTSLPSTDGKRLVIGGAPAYQVVYSTDWNAAEARGLALRQDVPNQLRYPKTMPNDRTVLTWCNYHVTTAGADKSNVLLASGTAKRTDFKQMIALGWNNFAN